MLAATARRNPVPPGGSHRREMNNAPCDGSGKRRTEETSDGKSRLTSVRSGSGFKDAGLMEQKQEALARSAVVS